MIAKMTEEEKAEYELEKRLKAAKDAQLAKNSQGIPGSNEAAKSEISEKVAKGEMPPTPEMQAEMAADQAVPAPTPRPSQDQFAKDMATNSGLTTQLQQAKKSKNVPLADKKELTDAQKREISAQKQRDGALIDVKKSHKK